MHGLGNDFVVIDNTANDISLSSELIKKIANRHFGVGCDQILVLQLPSILAPDVDFFYLVFNSDGSEAGQCGNGVRCLAKYVNIQGISKNESLVFATKDTKTKTFLDADGLVTAITQGPVFEPENIPLIDNAQAIRYKLQISDTDEIEFGAVWVGNPHAVVLVDDVDAAPVKALGSLISNSTVFPEKANVNFMQIMDSHHIKLRVYERGSGETLACGSGASASVVMGRLWGFLDTDVVVKLPGGDLVVRWNEADRNILITGPAELVFTGEIILER